MNDLARMLSSLGADDDAPPPSIRQQVINALNAYDATLTPRDYEVGDFVMLKRGCKAQRFPLEDSPCLVLHIEPIANVPMAVGQSDEHHSDGNAGKRENVLIGCVRGDSWATWWCDERILCRHADACKERDEYRDLMKAATSA